MVVISSCDDLVDWATVNGGDALDPADKQEGTNSIVVTGFGAAVEIAQTYDPAGTWDWSTYDHITFWFKTDDVTTSDMKLRIWSGANPANNYIQWNRQFTQQVKAINTWYQVKLYLDDYDTSVGAINLAAVQALRFYVLDTVGVVTFKLDYIRIDLPDPVKVKIGTAANLDYVSDDCLELDIWRDSLSGIGRWQVILENTGNKWGGDFIPDEAVELRINGVLMMNGYVDDVVPFLALRGEYTNHIKVIGRDYGMDLAQLYLTASYAQDNADDIVDFALAAAGSEITYVSPTAAAVIDYEFNRTYLADGIRDICKLIDYDFYVEDNAANPKRLQFFAVGAVGQHTAVNLTAVAAAATNNILKFEKGEKIGADIKNYIEAHAGGLQDHWTDLNASDWDATAAANCTLSDETTIFLAGKGAIKALATGATDLIADLDFSATLYEYTVLDMSERNEGSYLCYKNYVSDGIVNKACRIRLMDSTNRWIEFYKFNGLVSCDECTDDNQNAKWRKVVFPYGDGLEIKASGSFVSGYWQYVAPAVAFDWSNVEIIRFTSDPSWPRAAPDYFIIDSVEIPTVEVISIEQDAGSQASYGIRMLSIYRPDIKNQVELDEYTLSEEAKYKDPLETTKITAIGQTDSVYAGQSLDVRAPSHGIAALTKYRIMKLHHQVVKSSDDSPVAGYIFLTDYDLVKDEINPTQVIDPVRFARYKTPLEATVRDMRDKLIRLTKLDPVSTSGGAGGGGSAPVPVRIMYVGDETIKSVLGNVSTEIKTFRMIRNDSHGVYPITEIYFIGEAMVDAGTGYLKVSINGAAETTVWTFTDVAYAHQEGVAAIAFVNDSVNDISMRLDNTGAGNTTYNRTIEAYVVCG